ncbi:MAG: PQQ-binding-like beta-propeller repeat protein [Planctomycetota bacterium]
MRYCQALLLLAVSLVIVGGVDSRVEAQTENLEPPKKDWPMYAGHLKRNFVNPHATGIPESWDIFEGENVKYSVQLGSRAYGGPVVSDGKILVGTNNEFPRNEEITGDKGVMMCFNESDGGFLWQIVHDKLAAGRVWDWPQQGVCSTPAIEGDRFYYIGNRCEVICANINDGAIIWKVDMIGKPLNVFPHNIATCSPLILGDTLFLITSNGVDAAHLRVPSEQAPSFLALNKNNGEVLWSSSLPSESFRNIMHGQWSNPAYAEPNGEPQIIFPGGDGWVYSFEPKSGELLWKFDCNPKDAVYKLGGRGTANDFVATPVIYDDKLYISVGQDPEHDTGVGHLYCIDITKKPTNKDKDVSPTLEVSRNGDEVEEKDNPDSAEIWHYGGPATREKPSPTGETYYFGRSMSTCAIQDDLLYVAELGGHVHCLDAQTGKMYWTESMFSNTWSSPYLVDGKVFVGNDDGILFVFEHSKELNILAEIEHDDGTKIRTTPVATNGRLYYMTESPTKLWVIEEGAKSEPAE